MTEKKEWFESWFDTSYYHILYQHRDDTEAQVFIQNIVNHIGINKDQHVLDLCCGKGRHSIFLNSFGIQTTGVDLSENSIKEAKKSETKNLKFFVHDMRNPLENESFDVILNLFTSFGYFDDQTENEKVIHSIYNGLKKDGFVLIDFLNATKIKNSLIPFEIKTLSGIDFHISKEHDNKHVFKTIEFEINNQKHNYLERVQLLEKTDFERMLKAANFSIEGIYGSFDLAPFDEVNSDRLIILARKISK